MDLARPALSILSLAIAGGAMLAGTAGAFEPAPATARAAMVGAEDGAGAGTASVAAKRIRRAADGLFYVQAEVNGRPIRFLVDTGASVVVLTPADAAAAGVQPDPDRFNTHVETAGGSAPMAWAKLDAVRVAGREVRGVKAAVMRGGLGVSLLGQNMLARMGSIRIAGDQLELD